MAYTIAQKFNKQTNNLVNGLKKAVGGMKTSGEKNSTAVSTAPKSKAGLSAVREKMNSMGLDNSKIGWDNGYVTYNNQRFKPTEVIDGTSYAPQKEIQSFVNSAYKAEGKNPVRITDYPAPAGLGSISYSDNGMVSVGGENIPVLYMDGDRAVVNSADLDKAYKTLKEKTGIKEASEIRDEWQDKYASNLDEAYHAMKNYGDWNYNPATDPAYEAYRQMYEREGQRAYRDAAAKLASKNNGNMTSAAQTLANSQLAYYMSMLGDRISELQKNAYERYRGGYEMKKDNYDALSERADKAWDRSIQENDIAKADYEKTRESERTRTLDSDKKGDAERERAWEDANQRGYFTDEEASLLNIGRKDNGEYYTPNEIKIRDDLQYFTEVTMPQLDYESQLKLIELIRELELKKENDNQKAERDFNYDKRLAAYKAGLK